MNLKEFETYTAELEKLAADIVAGKRPAYTLGNADVLRNFKNMGDRVGLRPEQAWLVYFLKHVDAICSFVKDPTGPQAEPIETRFADALNYLKLGYALLKEKEAAFSSAPNDYPHLTPDEALYAFCQHSVRRNLAQNLQYNESETKK